jgi:2-hydroxy-palmitic acid dioxygenase Mpo1-like protein
MGIGQLLNRQWKGYSKSHQSRTNLLIHIVAVPLFWVGTFGLVAAFVQLSLWVLGVAIACVVVAVALQGRGHRLEPVPPEPFTGPLNFVSRIFFEQWITFPRFVLSGGWVEALRKAQEPRP